MITSKYKLDRITQTLHWISIHLRGESDFLITPTLSYLSLHLPSFSSALIIPTSRCASNALNSSTPQHYSPCSFLCLCSSPGPSQSLLQYFMPIFACHWLRVASHGPARPMAISHSLVFFLELLPKWQHITIVISSFVYGICFFFII